jgi:tetratricopeptide (TPR) repeat protein
MTAIDFTSRSTAVGGIIVAYRWDFGDGQGSTDPRPRHIYLAPGLYTVSLTVTSSAGQKAPCQKEVRVEPMRGELELTREKGESFLERVRAYRLGALPTPCLLGAWRLFRHLEREQMAFEAALQLDRRSDELEPSVRHETAMELARHYRDRERRYELAEQYLRVAEQSVAETSPRLQMEARFAVADLRFYQLDDPEGARREYVRLRADLSPARRDKRRLALIRIGDTYRREGRTDHARRAYREAEGEAVDGPDAPQAVLKGALFRQVESHLRNGEGERALEVLDELLWRYPTLRLDGRPALLRIRAELLEGDFREAKQQADVYLNFARDPNYVPAVHVEAAEACIELGLIEEARRHYRSVLDDFPESAHARDAENGLYRLRD